LSTGNGVGYTENKDDMNAGGNAVSLRLAGVTVLEEVSVYNSDYKFIHRRHHHHYHQDFF